MRRVALFVGVFFLATAALGAVTEITLTPQAPLVVGMTLDYKVVSNAQAVAGYRFRLRCLEGSTGPWSQYYQQSSPTFTAVEKRVGNYEIEGGANEQQTTNPPTFQWASLTKQVTILGPDSDTIIAGLNVNSTGWQPATVAVQFACWASGKKMAGSQIDGYPQERIRRPQYNPPKDSGWAGPKAGEFYWSMDHIQDNKTLHVIDMAWWNGLAVGAVFDDLFQQNRFVIKDCNGVDRYYYFQERHFQKVKTGPTTWKLIEV